MSGELKTVKRIWPGDLSHLQTGRITLETWLDFGVKHCQWSIANELLQAGIDLADVEHTEWAFTQDKWDIELSLTVTYVDEPDAGLRVVEKEAREIVGALLEKRGADHDQETGPDPAD